MRSYERNLLFTAVKAGFEVFVCALGAYVCIATAVHPMRWLLLLPAVVLVLHCVRAMTTFMRACTKLFKPRKRRWTVIDLKEGTVKSLQD